VGFANTLTLVSNVRPKTTNNTLMAVLGFP
jgi:hypothetical protein